MNNLYYYKTDVGNIGDDLNEWLWPDLLDLNNVKKDIKLIGVGSIITSALENEKDFLESTKITLGSGVRGIDSLPNLNTNWDLSFLRGPISSLYLTGNLDNYITDGAYCLRLHSKFKMLHSTKKRHPIAFMPYLRTSHLIPWEKICKELGIHYISPHPLEGIESKLKEIASCEYIITEAMHGGILADIFRIPWTKFQFASNLFEGNNTNELKWQDWTRGLGIQYETYNSVEFPKKVTFIPQLYTSYIKLKKNHLSDKIKVGLQNIINKRPQSLSNDSTLSTIDDKLTSEIESISTKIK